MNMTLGLALRSFVLASLLAAPPESKASVPASETELTPADFVGFRHFGSAVAIDGDTIVVGVPLDPEAGFNSGSAYVFVRSGSAWTQQARLTASDAHSSSQFGASVAVNGDTVVIGAPFTVTSGVDAGAAYVFVRSGSTWSQQARLAPTDSIGADQFGTALAIEGDTLAVGATGTGLTFAAEGAVYVLTRTGTAWSQRTRLRSDGPGPGNAFGFSLALNNGTLAVGSPDDDDLLLADAGAVYVFTGSGAAWSLQGELTAGDAAPDNKFGWAVALKGDTLVSGAPQNHSGADFAGAAYVFARTFGVWSQQAKLVANDSAAFDCFGFSVAVNNNAAFVGSVLDSSFAQSGGSTYVFTRVGTSWSQDSELSASDIAPFNRFGYALAVNGTNLVVGAPSGYFLEEGAAYVFEFASANTAPVANPQTVATSEDTATAITLTGSDAEGDPLTFIVLSNPANGTLSGTAPNLTYTPGPNLNGSDSFTFKVNDGDLDSATATVSINVTAVNDAPVAEDQSVATSEDTPVSVTLTGSDVEGSALSFTVLSGPAHGTLSGTAPNLTYTPNANDNGTDSFTFKVNDGALDSAPATVSITVTPVNDAPIVSGIPDQTIPVNSTTGPIAFTVDDIDDGPAGLTVVASSDNAALTPPGSITISGSGANRTITITPAGGQTGSATISVTVSDSAASTGTTFNLTVTASANQPPVADASATVTQIVSANGIDALVTLDGSRSHDPDNDALTYTWSESGNTIALGAVAQVTLPLGSHTITLTVNDGEVSANTVVTVQVSTLAQTISEIITAVQTADILSIQQNELISVLRAAADSCARGNLTSGVNQLQAFENKINAQAGKKIDEATARDLLADAQNVISIITGTTSSATSAPARSSRR